MPRMLAALYDGANTVELKRIERLAPGPGDALVKVRAEGICGSDLNQYRKLTEPETLPAGHETAGEIVEVGEGVDRPGSARESPWRSSDTARRA